MLDINEIVKLSLSKIIELYSTGELSPRDVITTHLNHCEQRNPEINAVFDIRQEYATQKAKESEKRWLKGSPIGTLDGIPILLKDSIKCKGFRYFHGSASYDGRPSDEDSPPAARIKEANGLVFGKTTMPDYGMLAAGISSEFGIIRNPWNLNKSPGGSSAGSGAALAAGLAPLSVGTDIAGSVRLPCAQNGLVGLKPSRGRIPHLAPSPIRAAGPMARNMNDLGLLMSVLVGEDHRDFESAPVCNHREFLAIEETPERFLKEKRIGLMLDVGFGPETDSRIVDLLNEQARILESLGAKIETVPKLTNINPMRSLYTLVKSRAYHELKNRPPELQPNLLAHIKDWCQSIKDITACELSDALFELEDFKYEVNTNLQNFDYTISPSLPIISFPAEKVAPFEHDHFLHCCFQIPFNQTGAPALSVNSGFIEGMPVGMQITGRRFDDVGVLKVGWLFEQSKGEPINWPLH